MRFLSSSLMMGMSLMLWVSTTQAQSFYKWVDAQGSTHYTLTPPPKSGQNMGQVKTYDGPPPPVISPSTTDSPTIATAATQETPLLPNLASMNPIELPTTPTTAANPPQTSVNKSPNKSYIPLPPPQAGAQANYY